MQLKNRTSSLSVSKVIPSSTYHQTSRSQLARYSWGTSILMHSNFFVCILPHVFFPPFINLKKSGTHHATSALTCDEIDHHTTLHSFDRRFCQSSLFPCASLCISRWSSSSFYHFPVKVCEWEFLRIVDSGCLKTATFFENQYINKWIVDIFTYFDNPNGSLSISDIFICLWY